jgi:hypothetical protein
MEAMKDFIRKMLTDDKTGNPSSSRVAGFIALIALCVFGGVILSATVLGHDMTGTDFVAWGFVSVVISLFLGKEVRFFGKGIKEDEEGN